MAAPPTAQLRADAESVLAHRPRAQASARSAQELLHELQVHQIEMEMQNESLRQSQVALEESRDRYVDLYEFAPIGYLTLNHAGLIADINLTGTALLGEERGPLRQRRFARFVVPEDQHKWRKHFFHALRHGGKTSCELSLQRRDGSIFFARLDSLHTAGNDGAPALRIALNDITDRIRAMAELRASEARLRAAKSAAGLGIYDVDIARDQAEWDERLRQIWGIGPDQPAGYAAFIAGVHPDDREATKAAIDRAFNAEGSGEYRAEYRVINLADRSLHHVASSGQAFFENGRVVRFVGTVKDVSAQKQQQQEDHKRRSEMELLLNQQVAAQTAAAIAHELNQPLISISAYSEAALRMLRGGIKNPEKLAHALEGAVDQALRAGQTLHELMDFLRKGEAARGPTDLNDVVRDALTIAAESGFSGFHSVLELESGLRPVLANRLQIQKVLINLLRNGVEAMRHIGVPTAAITITVRTLSEKDMALVTVQDSGPGLDMEASQRIFEPFFSTKPTGMGLGLAISRSLIEAHGGRLWANPEQGPGATFHFTVPFA